MTEILSLAFPGFIAVTVYRWFGRSRSRTGWDYLVLTGVAGGTSYLLAWILAYSIAGLHQLDGWREIIDRLFPGRYDNGTYMLSFPIAVCLGWIASRGLYSDRMRRFCEWIGMRHPPGEIDALSQLQIDADTHPVVVSTTLGQVYIGQIQKVTTDPDEDTRIVVIRVFAGGSRIEERSSSGSTTRRVKYNYVIDHTRGEPRSTYLDLKDVVSISQFGLPEFEQTLDSGYSQISDEDFDVLLRCLAASFEGFAEEADEYYEDEEQQLKEAIAQEKPDP